MTRDELNALGLSAGRRLRHIRRAAARFDRKARRSLWKVPAARDLWAMRDAKDNRATVKGSRRVADAALHVFKMANDSAYATRIARQREELAAKNAARRAAQ